VGTNVLIWTTERTQSNTPLSAKESRGTRKKEEGTSISETIREEKAVVVTTFLIPNHYYFILTHYSDPTTFDSSYMTYLFQAQSALLRFTAELSQLNPLLDYSSHDYSALLIVTHYV